MNKDEIKDLLQYLKNVYESEETSTWLNKLQIKDLLDYITNLQNENMKYDQCLTELTDNYKELQKDLTNLQEENERLKIKCDFLAGKKMVELDKNAKQVEIKAIQQIDYKTRNEKAIEYIKSHKEERAYYEPFGTPTGIPNHYEYFVEGYYELLEVLQGKSD